MPIEADDIFQLFRELAIIAQLEGLHPMRFETVRPPDAAHGGRTDGGHLRQRARTDRKSTRLNSSHLVISYAVFCLKKKKELSTCRQRCSFGTITTTHWPIETCWTASSPSPIATIRTPVRPISRRPTTFFFKSWAPHRDLPSFPTRPSSV